MSDAPKVYAAIAAVQAAMAHEGVSKSRKNQQQNYQFRGIDEIYNALATHLAKHRLSILPRVLKREQTERPSKSGGTLFYVVVEAEFDFVSAEDGSKHTVKLFGEAMDSADKATNKAMSAAFKYACLQAFCIPTEGDNDADATTPELAAEPIHLISPAHVQVIRSLLVELNKTEEQAVLWASKNRTSLMRDLTHQEGTLLYDQLLKAKTEDAETQQVLSEWETRLAADPTIDQLNEMLSELPALAKPVKTAVWHLIQEYTGKAGLVFDKETKRFFAPEEQPV